MLDLDSKGNTLSLSSMIPAHKVETVEVEYRDEEEAKSQWVHRTHARLVLASNRYG